MKKYAKLFVMAILSIISATSVNAQETFGKINLGDSVVDLDNDESIDQFNTNRMYVEKREMPGDTCVVLTLYDYEYEGTGIEGSGCISYYGNYPLVLDLNGKNKISIVGDPNSNGSTSGVSARALVLMGDGSLEINIDKSVRFSMGVMAMVILSTSPSVMEEWEISDTDYKYFTGKVTVNNYGEGDSAAGGMYALKEAYLGGGEYEFNTFGEGKDKNGLIGGRHLMVDASKIHVNCPHGNGIATTRGSKFIDSSVEVYANCAYFSAQSGLEVESSEVDADYTVMAGNDAHRATVIDLQAEDVVETLKSAKYMRICNSAEQVTNMQTIASTIASDADFCYDQQGNRITNVKGGYKGIVIKNGKKFFAK